MNIRLAQKEENTEKTLAKYEEVARILSGNPNAAALKLVTQLKLQRRSLKMPKLDSFGIKKDDIPQILKDCRTGSMSTNPIYLNDRVLSSTLRKLLR